MWVGDSAGFYFFSSHLFNENILHCFNSLYYYLTCVPMYEALLLERTSWPVPRLQRMLCLGTAALVLTSPRVPNLGPTDANCCRPLHSHLLCSPPLPLLWWISNPCLGCHWAHESLWAVQAPRLFFLPTRDAPDRRLQLLSCLECWEPAWCFRNNCPWMTGWEDVGSAAWANYVAMVSTQKQDEALMESARSVE